MILGRNTIILILKPLILYMFTKLKTIYNLQTVNIKKIVMIRDKNNFDIKN